MVQCSLHGPRKDTTEAGTSTKQSFIDTDDSNWTAEGANAGSTNNNTENDHRRENNRKKSRSLIWRMCCFGKCSSRQSDRSDQEEARDEWV